MGRNKNKKNPKGGKKHKQKASKDFKTLFTGKMVYKNIEDGQLYAIVDKRLGGNRLLVKATINKELKEVQAVIPGKFRNRIFMKTSDIILIQTRGFNNNQFDVIYKYSDGEVKKLKDENLINDILGCENNSEEDDNVHIQFTNKIDEDEDEEEDIYDNIYNDYDTNYDNHNKDEINFDDI